MTSATPIPSALDVLDILSVDDKPRLMPIVDPATGTVIRSRPTAEYPQGEPAYLMILSANSSAGDAVSRDAFDRARGERKKANSDGLSYDDLMEMRSGNIAALIRGWRIVHPATKEVMDFPYTPENAEALMSSPNREWLRKQAEAFAKDDANFMKG